MYIYVLKAVRNTKLNKMTKARVSIITTVTCQHCNKEEERYINLEDKDKVYCSKCDKDTGFSKESYR